MDLDGDLGLADREGLISPSPPPPSSSSDPAADRLTPFFCLSAAGVFGAPTAGLSASRCDFDADDSDDGGCCGDFMPVIVSEPVGVSGAVSDSECDGEGGARTSGLVREEGCARDEWRMGVCGPPFAPDELARM